LGIYGAKVIGNTDDGNCILKLNRKTYLGSKGDLIYAPRDLSIFEHLRKFGRWEIEVSEFLSESLKSVGTNLENKSVLLDIGANVGLVTVQAMNMSGAKNDVYLFEPLKGHAQAIRNNTKNINGDCKVNVVNVALSDQDGVSVIYTEVSNHGNSSLFSSAVPLERRNQIEISTVETSRYISNLLLGYDRIVIKSDTQGMDALILAKFPIEAWDKVFSVVVEVWALSDICETDVDKLVALWSSFEYISWSPDFKSAIDLIDVRNYWISKSNNQRNLFLKRKLSY
jgi:FkbM family methyltransferase